MAYTGGGSNPPTPPPAYATVSIDSNRTNDFDELLVYSWNMKMRTWVYGTNWSGCDCILGILADEDDMIKFRRGIFKVLTNSLAFLCVPLSFHGHNSEESSSGSEDVIQNP